MPTNFLPAGIINDKLGEIAELAAELVVADAADEQVKATAARIFEMTSELQSFINGFSSQPIIFTGMGTTEEIIARLEWLLTFADEEPGINPAQPPRTKARKR